MPPGLPVHVIQRGNNRQTIFCSDEDMATYASDIRKAAEKFSVKVHGWVFMTNHAHLLLTPSSDGGISKLMQSLGRCYVAYFNFNYSRSGTLFEGRFRASLVEEHNYLLECLRYIELNPVRAGMVKDPGNYRWSSYQTHAFGTPVTMWSPLPQFLELGPNAAQRQAAWRNLIGEVLDAELITKIRQCANAGLVLGSQNFREQVERLRS